MQRNQKMDLAMGCLSREALDLSIGGLYLQPNASAKLKVSRVECDELS